MKRFLLKLSGEALAGEKKTGFDEAAVLEVAKEVKELLENKVQLSVVIGGGNFWRGRFSEKIDRTKADQIGMLATVMNCLYVSEIMRSIGISTVIMTPFQVGAFTELFSKDKAIEALSAGKVVFFAGGTGHPFFSTDTGASLRAIETESDGILLAKTIDGVYSADPKVDDTAVRYDSLSIEEVVEKKLQVLDLSASVMCMEHHMPLYVFSLFEKGEILKAASGADFNGTIVTA